MSSPLPPTHAPCVALGVDCSTQSLKLTAIDERRQILAQVAVSFEAELPHYGTQAGVRRNDYGFGPLSAESVAARGGEVITSPSLMFVEALELALEKLRAIGLSLRAVRCISASGQQHGSVYWKRGAGETLSSLSPSSPLSAQLACAFSLPCGPIWMDSSTRRECAAMESALGGAQQLADVTGSRAFERFTGQQIAKIAHELPAVYDETERISLVSSLIPSLFLGAYAPIDAADAAGMNLMDIRASSLPFEWSDKCLAAAMHGTPDSLGGIAGVRERLGPIVDSAALLGAVSSYWVSRWGFSPECEVVASSGDNPCSLVGLGLSVAGEVGVSLGTSDTLFAVMPTGACRPLAECGHVFPNPSDVLHTRMLMICVKNGSLAREAVKRSLGANASWDEFNAALKATPAGNDGNFFFAFPECEITPATHRSGYFSFPAGTDQPEQLQQPDAASDRGWVRGTLESQFLSLRLHAAKLGLAQPKRLVVTGGASVNSAVVQLLADVFGCDVQGLRIIGQTNRKTHAERPFLACNSSRSHSSLLACCPDALTGESRGQLSDTASLGAAYRALASHELRHTYTASAAAARAADMGDTGEQQTSAEEPADDSLASATSLLPHPATVISVTLATFDAKRHETYQQLMPEFERKQNICVQLLNRK